MQADYERIRCAICGSREVVVLPCSICGLPVCPICATAKGEYNSVTSTVICPECHDHRLTRETIKSETRGLIIQMVIGFIIALCAFIIMVQDPTDSIPFWAILSYTASALVFPYTVCYMTEKFSMFSFIWFVLVVLTTIIWIIPLVMIIKDVLDLIDWKARYQAEDAKRKEEIRQRKMRR